MPDDYFPVTLRKLTLRNFRKYDNLSVDLNAPVVMITGKNGSGKTSVLEAIAMASSLRSFRRSNDKEMIEWEKEHYSMELEFKGPDGIEVLKLGYGKADASNPNAPYARSLIANGSKVKTISEFIGRFQTVVFSPEDLKIVEGGPSERRKYVDMVLSLLSSGYLDALQKYKKGLEVRAAALKKSANMEGGRSYIQSIDRELSTYGSFIQQARRQFIHEFQEPFQNNIQRISTGEDKWQISYKPSIENGEEKNAYFEQLKNSFAKDARYKQTFSGVHRDRFLIHLPGAIEKELRMVASQGQKRTAALALRMAQYHHTREKTHETPVILIDDVLTELDATRRNGFVKFMSEVGQALIALTDTSSIQDFIQAKKDFSKTESGNDDSNQNSLKILVYETSNQNGATLIQAPV